MSDHRNQPRNTRKKNNLLIWSGISLAAIVVVLVLLFIVQRVTTYYSVKKAIAFEEEYMMVAVEGGSFQMGKDFGWSDQKPAHKVTLKGFYIGKFEVTQKQWRMIMGKNPSMFTGCDECPVEQVSWLDVQKFIHRLNHKTGFGFRLPTEAEWEYAAIGGNKSRGYIYSGSNDKNAAGWNKENSRGKPRPVGTKDSNELGLYDMSGNILEWCNDYYGKSYYKLSPSHNPKGPLAGENRVLRGGSWAYDEINDETSLRFYNSPSVRNEINGFRLCRDTKD